MVKVIIAKNKIDCEDKLGNFLDENDYDILIEDDTDCYMPRGGDLSSLVDDDEKFIAFKFRKNWFSEEEQRLAYKGLVGASDHDSDNRGLASGPRGSSQGKCDWISTAAYAIIDYLKDPNETLIGETREEVVQSFLKKYTTEDDLKLTRGSPWKRNGDKEHFNFDDWLEETLALDDTNLIKNAALKLEKDRMSKTSYSKRTLSGIAGWFDRYARFPYGRATRYTMDNPDKFSLAYPFLRHLDEGFSSLMPVRWKKQKNAADTIDDKFKVPDTVFTTLTVNQSFRTAAHRDAGDFSEGLSNLLVVSNDGNYTGGYLIFPEYRIAVNVRPGDLLLVNNHEIMHGNTEIKVGTKKSIRLSLVVYLRENMLELGSYEYESLRKKYVIERSKNKEHEEWRQRWNGVSPSMFSLPEWKEFMVIHAGEEKALDWHPELFKKESSLGDLL